MVAPISNCEVQERLSLNPPSKLQKLACALAIIVGLGGLSYAGWAGAFSSFDQVTLYIAGVSPLLLLLGLVASVRGCHTHGRCRNFASWVITTAWQNPDGITLDNGRKMTQADLFKRAITYHPGYSSPYWGLAFEEGEVTLEDGSVMTQMDLLKRAIDCDPHHKGAYWKLASLLPDYGSVLLENGEVMTKQELEDFIT